MHVSGNFPSHSTNDRVKRENGVCKLINNCYAIPSLRAHIYMNVGACVVADPITKNVWTFVPLATYQPQLPVSARHP